MLVQLATQYKNKEILELFERHIAATTTKSDIITSGQTDHSDLDLHSVIPAEEN